MHLAMLVIESLVQLSESWTRSLEDQQPEDPCRSSYTAVQTDYLLVDNLDNHPLVALQPIQLLRGITRTLGDAPRDWGNR